jgi:inosine/xanthosine triphosphate pyrophosphatase family protein
MKLVLATHNQGKVQELRAILEPNGFELAGYDGPEPVEDGTSVVIPSALTTTTIAVTSAITVILGVFPAPLINFIESTAFFIR